MGFTAPTPHKCDLILSQEEYDLVMQHRAMKRWAAKHNQRKDAHGSSLVDTPALRKLLGHKSALEQLRNM